MSMIRLTFQVTPFDTEPTSPQFAGVQGSHQAVEVLFKLDDRLYDPSYRYRMEFLDGTGAADTSDLLTPYTQTDSNQRTLSILLPDGWTQAGGGGEIRLAIARLNDWGHEEFVFYSMPARIYFSSKEDEGRLQPLRHGLSSLIFQAHQAVDKACDAAENANEAADAANEAAGSVNEALSNAAEAIDGANAARDAANLAAQEAKEAAATAEEEAEAAHQISLAAQAAAGKADIAATAAQNAASAAQSAASAANTAAGTANTAAGTANAAASAANAAAEAANEAADAANEAAASIADKVDAVDALPVHTMERQSGPDSWKPTPGIAVPDTGPYTGMAIRAVWAEEWDASVPVWCFGGIVPIKPAGTYPAGAYILMYDGEAWQAQASMERVQETADEAADKAAEAHAAQVRRTYQPAWKRTAGGCPLSVADAAEGADLSSLVLKGRTVVSGTPSPDAPVTITGVKPQTVAVTGKNLLPYSEQASEITSRGITMRDNADGTYTFNGTADGSRSPWFNTMLSPALVSGWYTLNPQGMKADNNCMTTIYKAPTYYTTKGNTANSFYMEESNGPFMLAFQFASDTVLENVTVKPILTRGQESFEFEPYRGETITPDEVELYGDAHAVGKNLIPTFEGSASINGISVSINTDGSITLNGTATANAYFYMPDMMIKAGTYTLSTGGNLAGGTSLVLRTRSGNVWLINIQAGSKSKTEAVSYSGAAQAYIAVASGTTLSNLTLYPQLEAGSEATAYEPYQGMTTALEDGDSLDLATGEVVRRWKRLELDGTEKWTFAGTNDHGISNFYTPLTDPYVSKPPTWMCTHYPNQNTLFADTTDRGIMLSAGYTAYIRETYTTVEDFKAYLAAQKEAGTPVTVLYRMKKPEVVSGWAHSLAQPEGEMVISALGNRGETAEAVDTEALYTYRPDWDDVLNRLAALENLISGGDVTSAELAAHNTNESAHANLVIDGNIK